MSSVTRRNFLATTSLAFGGTLVSARTLPGYDKISKSPGNALLPEPINEEKLRNLAIKAIEAAQSLGASYADIRIAEQHVLYTGLIQDPMEPHVSIQSTLSYGIRAVVDGIPAFTYGSDPTVDSVTQSARMAVAAARGYLGAIKRTYSDFIPAKPVTGEWSVPVEIDPFTIPLEDQVALLHAYQAAAKRVRYGTPGWRGTRFRWTRELRVFASTEGSLITQRFSRSAPVINGAGDYGSGDVSIRPSRVKPASGGFETVTLPGLQEEIKDITEKAVKLASLPRRQQDVGRYHVVFDGITFGNVLGSTIGQALEIDRALGDEADASGTSFLSPPLSMLGKPVSNQVLNVIGHRSLPAISAVKWDDEGVEPEEYSIVKDGSLVDYHTTRSNASALSSWYNQRNMEIKSHGCAAAYNASHPVLVRMPNLSVSPAKTSSSVEDLYTGIDYGILVLHGDRISTDQQFSSGILTNVLMFEVRKGKIVARVSGNGLQFHTGRFLKSLLAVGDETTMYSSAMEITKGQPWRTMIQSVSAPAASFKEIDVISTKVSI